MQALYPLVLCHPVQLESFPGSPPFPAAEELRRVERVCTGWQADSRGLLVLEPTQVAPQQHMLRPGGVLITPDAVRADQLPSRKTLNVALLGALSAHLPMTEEQWLAALRAGFAENFFAGNRQAFLTGREAQKQASPNLK